MKKTTILLLLSCIFFIQCKDEISSESPTFLPPLESINSTVHGKIIDNDLLPVEGARVILNNEETLTNELGLFSFTNSSMNKNGTFIKVQKQGFFLGSRRFYPTEEASQMIQIQLLPLQIVGNISSNTGGQLAFENGNKIEFQANSIVDANGNSYNGNVNVSAKYIDPSRDDLEDIMPGDLTGISQSEEYVSLASYGMMAVELTDDNGNELNGSATLTFSVPNELVSSAPEIIPLWFFDEEIGIWKEEGEATLVDGSYIGDVDHFSFWNCDELFPLIDFKGKVINTDGSPASNYKIEMSMSTSNSVGTGITNSVGIFEGKIPANEILDLTIYDQCDNSVHQEQIGPFSQATIYPITLQSNTLDVVTISGNLMDCDGNSIQNSILYISNSNMFNNLYSINTSNFSQTLNFCSSPQIIDLIIFNSDYSAFENIQVPYSNNINLGSINICENNIIPTDSITVIFPETNSDSLFIGTLNYSVLQSTYYPSGDSTSIIGFNNFNNEPSFIRINFTGTQIGLRDANEIKLYHNVPNVPDENLHSNLIGDDVSILFDCEPSSDPCNLGSFEISQYGNNIQGVYTGSVTYTSLVFISPFPVPLDTDIIIQFNATLQ